MSTVLPVHYSEGNLISHLFIELTYKWRAILSCVDREAGWKLCGSQVAVAEFHQNLSAYSNDHHLLLSQCHNGVYAISGG